MRIFKEEQRFNQSWLIALIVISVLIPIGLLVNSYVRDPNSFSTMEFTLIITSVVLASVFIFLFKLSTRIDEEGIHYKFFPFHFRLKTIKWNEINKAYVRNYDAVTEYGGWGIKGGSLWKKSNGKAINVSGSIGIQLKLKNGDKLLIGTQKKEQVKNVISTYKSKLKK